MFREFKEFAMRGNVLDMGVGVVIGAAFGKIVNSLVEDVIMPPLGLLIGRVNLSGLFISLSGKRYASLAEAKAAGAATINVGLFINTVLNFIIVAFAVFLLIRAVNRMQRQKQAAPAVGPTTATCSFCYSTIPIKATRCPHCTSMLEPPRTVTV